MVVPGKREPTQIVHSIITQYAHLKDNVSVILCALYDHPREELHNRL